MMIPKLKYFLVLYPLMHNSPPLTSDISLASQSRLLSSFCTPIRSLGSDHLPILIELPLDESIPFLQKKTFIQFLRADWRQITYEIESVALPRDFVLQLQPGRNSFGVWYLGQHATTYPPGATAITSQLFLQSQPSCC